MVFTNNDSAYATAQDLMLNGAKVSVVDARPSSEEGAAGAARKAGIEVRFGSAIVDVAGAKRVQRRARRLPGRCSERRRMDGGRCRSHVGRLDPGRSSVFPVAGQARMERGTRLFCSRRAVQAQRCVGACRGGFSTRAALEDAIRAGLEAARAAGFEGGTPVVLPELADERTRPLFPLWQVSIPRARSKAFVDFQSDVTTADLALAAREGFVAVEHLKRYTTTGMATDQGKTSNVNALALLSEMTGKSIPETGVTTFRPPYTPVTFGALAGRDVGERLEPIRVTPIHRWHVGHGAHFENVGQWKRPWYYPRPGEDMASAVARECQAVRTSVGVLDASTLGKIEIVGADAAEFLDRVYTNDFKTLGVGRCRYGLMCKDDGMVFDDGVATRLAQDRFYVTTTTGGAGRVLDWLEEWLQTEWRDLKVYLTSVTEQWSVIAVAGPKAREVLRRLAPEMALDPQSFPFMSMREGVVAGTPCPGLSHRIQRRAELRDRSAGRARLGHMGGGHGGRPALRHHALRHRRPCTCCAPRRASSSSAMRPTAASPRSTWVWARWCRTERTSSAGVRSRGRT